MEKKKTEKLVENFAKELQNKGTKEIVENFAKKLFAYYPKYLYVICYSDERNSGTTDKHYMSFTQVSLAQKIADECSQRKHTYKIVMNVYRIKDIGYCEEREYYKNGYLDSITFYNEQGKPFYKPHYHSFDYLQELEFEKKYVL